MSESLEIGPIMAVGNVQQSWFWSSIHPSVISFLRNWQTQINPFELITSNYCDYGIVFFLFGLYEFAYSLEHRFFQDVVAMTSLPLPGYTVSTGNPDKASSISLDRELEGKLVFKLSHSKKAYYFMADDRSMLDR